MRFHLPWSIDFHYGRVLPGGRRFGSQLIQIDLFPFYCIGRIPNCVPQSPVVILDNLVPD